MNLHDLSAPHGSNRKPKRRGIGLASGNGKTAGKGHKGQKARAGRSVAPYFEGGQMPLSRRIPKRGFSNFRFAKNFQTVNVGDLAEKLASDVTVVTAEELAKVRLINDACKPVKVLGNGEISRAMTIRANAFSKSAESKIAAAGGHAEVI